MTSRQNRALLGLNLVFLAYITFSAYSNRAVAAGSSSQVQYLVVPAGGGTAGKQALLDKNGKEGWQLVAVDCMQECNFIFKR